jgi:hypothetical protein
MRAIMAGVVGAVLIATGAEAKSCRPEDATLRSEDCRVLAIVKTALGGARVDRDHSASRLLLAVKLAGNPYLLDQQAIQAVMSSVMTSEPGHKPSRFVVMPKWRPSNWKYSDSEVLDVSGRPLSGRWTVSCSSRRRAAKQAA